MRVLKSYRRVAMLDHWCDRCCQHINPGEEYEGNVWVDERKESNRIVVFKTHINPSCEEPPDPTDDDFGDGFKEVEFKLAA